MYLVTRQTVEEYLQEDIIAHNLERLSRPEDEKLTCQKWLNQIDAKRFIYNELYGDLLNGVERRRVLDVGGGLTALSRKLAVDHDYVLVDLLAHDDAEAAKMFEEDVGKPFVHVIDWYEFALKEQFDIVIANDLFPNVDQRLELFLERVIPFARQVRLSLTYFSEPRFYKAQRTDADEILCLLAWTGEMIHMALKRYEDRIVVPQFDLLTAGNPSVYPNNRQVCLVELTGSA